MYPPQPAFVRQVTHETQIRGITIPKGTDVSIVPYLVHRDPAYWPNPDTFDPERFSKRTQHLGFEYIPFSGGYRSCIGKNMAMIELRVVLATILKNYTISVINPEKVVPIPAVTLRPNELLVTVHARNKQNS